MNKTHMVVAAAAAGLLSLAAPATAGVIYAEGPDLTPNLAIPKDLGALQLGSNVFTGALHANYECFSTINFCTELGDGADAFKFTIGADQHVVSAKVTISHLSVDHMTPGLRSSTQLLFYRLLADGVVDILPASDLTGTQDLQLYAWGLDQSTPGTAQFDWSFEVVTEQRSQQNVPLPGTLLLSLAGLAALSAVRTRRQPN